MRASAARRSRPLGAARRAPQESIESITGAVAGVWLPIDIASAHYSVCDALGFSSREQLDIGGEVIHKLPQTFLSTVLKTARAAGTLSPWVGLPKFSALVGRSFQRGGSQVGKLGPKDVRFDVVGFPIARINCFRVAYRGFVRAGSQLFTEKCFVNDVTKPGMKGTLSFRVAWA